MTRTTLFTHVAQYQGNIVAAIILGGDRRADYKGIPRVVFSDPEIAAVGLTEEEARERGISVASVNLELASSLARPVTYEKEPRGTSGSWSIGTKESWSGPGRWRRWWESGSTRHAWRSRRVYPWTPC
ncbi:MAG TPA: hypothetical protein VI027_13370 [Rubrobacteraceae bacterium]